MKLPARLLLASLLCATLSACGGGDPDEPDVPARTWETDALDMGYAEVGQTVSRQIVVFNQSARTLDMTQLVGLTPDVKASDTATPAPGLPVDASRYACSSTPSLGSCVLTLTWSPTDVGPLQYEVKVQGDPSGQALWLDGYAAAAPEPPLPPGDYGCCGF